jgi:hypothetical protein
MMNDFTSFPIHNLAASLLPNLGAVTSGSAFIGLRSGLGQFSADAVRAFLGGVVTVQQFGAVGDGAANDSGPIQAAIDYCIANRTALHVPAVATRYRINTPLNLTAAEQLVIFGDGCDSYPGPSLAPRGSVISGNTGGLIMDCVGGRGIKLVDLTLSSIGEPSPSIVGIVMGPSAAQPAGGYNCGLFNVTIAMPPTGTSLPFYGVSTNIMTLSKLSTIGDFGVVLVGSNILGVGLPFGAFGTNVGADAIYSSGCFLNGYGPEPVLIMDDCNSHTHDQLYIHTNAIGPSFTGSNYAMTINDSTDVLIKVQVDGFPSAVLQDGFWRDIRLWGLIFQGTTPVDPGQPFISSLQGSEIDSCEFMIRPVTPVPASFHYSSGILDDIQNTRFLFDTEMSDNVLALSFGGAVAKPLFNCRLDGNSDTLTNSLVQSGSPLADSAKRLFINGIVTGTG